MKATELKALLAQGALERYAALYPDLAHAAARMSAAIDTFESRFGTGRELMLLSVPGRSEISGNHTDHNRGCVLAGAIDRDIIAVVSPNPDELIHLWSEGYEEDTVLLSETGDPARYPDYSSAALIAGVVNGFVKEGYRVGGYDAYMTTEVLKGSGISSSAAYEVMIGNVLNHLYNDGSIDNQQIAKLSQYAENVYFGKPCGLMDQMACAVGGFVYIDFADADAPIVDPIDFSLTDAGYSLCIVNTGGNHADLNDDYASVPREMRAVAQACGQEVLRGLTEDALLPRIPALRATVGDRAILRALHFIRENGRVEQIRDALRHQRTDEFLTLVRESGRSSFEYLQNVYTVHNVEEQGLSLALAVTEGLLSGRSCAYRVHGGGFAGTIQVFLRNEDVESYCQAINAIFGEGAAMRLRIRPAGACRLF